MKKLTNKTIYSAAKPGAGVYNFLIFSENVPDSSTVILAISKPVQLRPLSSDRNIASFSIPVLYKMYQNNYSVGALFQIIKKNIKTPANNYITTTLLYPSTDSIKYVRITHL